MKFLRKYLPVVLLIALMTSCGSGDGVYFENLTDGQEVSSTVLVEMGVSGMEIEPAGEVNKGMGHHHIIIDGTHTIRRLIQYRATDKKILICSFALSFYRVAMLLAVNMMCQYSQYLCTKCTSVIRWVVLHTNY